MASSIRVLVVDDEVDLGAAVKDALDENGCTAVYARTCTEALEASESLAFDVAVLDLAMPEMSGVELAKHLRSKQPRLATVLMSAYLPSETVDGFESVLAKPFSVPKLTEAVRSALRSRERSGRFDPAAVASLP